MARNKRKALSSDEPILHSDHKRPVTRRDFLNAGFITSAATVMMPGFVTSLLNRKAFAATTDEVLDCGIGGLGGGNKVPFLCFDLGGGANMAGSNVLIGGSGGQLDFLSPAGYNKMGVPNNMLPSADPAFINTELGLAFHSDSAFLRGILSKTTQECRDNINGAVIPARSDNDTANNPHNPMYGIAKGGAKGQLANLIGTRNSDSGGRSMAPAAMIDLTIRPTKIANRDESRGLVDTGAVSALMPDKEEAGRIMEAVEKISLAKIDGATTDSVPQSILPDSETVTNPDGTTVQELVHCGYKKTTITVSSFGGPDDVDPEADPLMVDPGAATQPNDTVSNETDDLNVLRTAVTTDSPIFTSSEISGGKLERTAAVAKLVVGAPLGIDLYAGAGTIEFGGYDYHNGTRATGEIRDFEAGQAIGASLEYAKRIGRPLMIYVFTDGSLASNGNIDGSANGRDKGEWTGDNGSTSAAFFLVYNPSGRPQLKTNMGMTAAQHQQLGWMRSSGSVETNNSTPGANNVNLLAEMCVLNWMALNNDVGNFASVLKNHGLGNEAELDRWIAFEPLA